MLRYVLICLVFVSAWAVRTEALIPHSVKKVAVLDFSGPEDSGVYVSQFLRSHLRWDHTFAILDDEILLAAIQRYPYLFDQKIDSALLLKLGRVLNVDAILVGHIEYLDVNETVEKGEEDVAFLQTESRLKIKYYLYSVLTGTLLAEETFLYRKREPEKQYRYKEDNELHVLMERMMQESVYDIARDLRRQRTELGVRHLHGPVPLAGSSHKDRFAKMELEYSYSYGGVLAPETKTNRFLKGDLLWLNSLLKNFKQTEMGEIWVQVHVQIFDKDHRRVVNLPLILDYHRFNEAINNVQKIPISLRIQLPAWLDSGSYSVRVLYLDRVHAESLLDIKNIEIS